MKSEFNWPQLKERRQKLRKCQTHAELLLWQCLRNRQLNGAKFFRQYSVGPFILDFYCPAKHLAIELDGGQHSEKSRKTYDRERSEYFENFNIQVLRFWNNDVIRNIDGPLEEIISHL